MKKLLSLLLVSVMALALVACGSADTTADTAADSATESTASGADVKIGVILLGDENEAYTNAHIIGIKEAAKAAGIGEDAIIWKYSIDESDNCYNAAVDLVDQGCTAIFSNSYGHQSFMQQVASEYPDVQFVSMTGDTAALSGLDNFSNAFNYTFESRYISGVVAGMKLAELDAAGKIPAESFDADGNVKIGYVGAYPYAEVVSGYTSFYLGVKSIYENVVMDVVYTNSWFDIAAESEGANTLISRNCVIIGQHADSQGAPTAVQAAKDAGNECVYSVGYNVDMLNVAPSAALTSATNNWNVYYTMAFKKVVAGEKIPTNWAAGYAEDAVQITALGPECADGTQAAVDEAIAAIKSGSLHVFSTDSFTVGGKHLDSYLIDTNGDFQNDDEEAIWDGYFHESEIRSAPSFDIRIDGITELSNE